MLWNRCYKNSQKLIVTGLWWRSNSCVTCFNRYQLSACCAEPVKVCSFCWTSWCHRGILCWSSVGGDDRQLAAETCRRWQYEHLQVLQKLTRQTPANSDCEYVFSLYSVWVCVQSVLTVTVSLVCDHCRLSVFSQCSFIKSKMAAMTWRDVIEDVDKSQATSPFAKLLQPLILSCRSEGHRSSVPVCYFLKCWNYVNDCKGGFDCVCRADLELWCRADAQSTIKPCDEETGLASCWQHEDNSTWCQWRGNTVLSCSVWFLVLLIFHDGFLLVNRADCF